MPSFRPRIGKKKIKRFDRIFWQEKTDDIRTFDAHEADIVDLAANPIRTGFAAGFGDAPDQSLDSEKHPFAFHETEDGDQRVNESKDLEEHARGAGSGHSAKQKYNARSNMHDTMGRVHHKDAEQHRHTAGVWAGDRGDESEDSDRE